MFKLIRDKYDEVIDPKLLFKIPKGDLDVIRYVDRKIDEELLELRESDFKDINEYADVVEVLMKMAKENGISEAEVNLAREAKNEKRGRFSNNLIFNYRNFKEKE